MAAHLGWLVSIDHPAGGRLPAWTAIDAKRLANDPCAGRERARAEAHSRQVRGTETAICS